MIVKLHKIGLAQNGTKAYKVHSGSGTVVTVDPSGREEVIFWSPNDLVKKMSLLEENLHEATVNFFIDEDGDMAVFFEEK